MGKIVAIGGGFDNDFLVRHILSLCSKKKPNFLHIPTTCYDNRGTELYSRFFRWGCEVDMLFLTHDYVTEQMTAEKIRRADIINVPGGNLRFALEAVSYTHLDVYKRQLSRYSLGGMSMARLVLPQADGNAAEMYLVSPVGSSMPRMSMCSAIQPSFQP